MDYYGLRAIVKEWLRSYLTNRTQYVEINNIKSPKCNINCGMPQGSILGPLLYFSTASNSTILSFADDTTLIIKHHDIHTLYANANL